MCCDCLFRNYLNVILYFELIFQVNICYLTINYKWCFLQYVKKRITVRNIFVVKTSPGFFYISVLVSILTIYIITFYGNIIFKYCDVIHNHVLTLIYAILISGKNWMSLNCTHCCCYRWRSQFCFFLTLGSSEIHLCKDLEHDAHPSMMV